VSTDQSPTTLKRRVVRRLVGQFMRPHGLGGHLAGWVMAHRSSNVQRNRWVVSLLDVQPTDRILEVGFGPGIAVGELSRLATRGLVLGIDHSEVMVRQARRRNAAAVRAGRVDLRLGSAEALPDLDRSLDKILAVNSMGFWPDPPTQLNELHARLRHGGKIAIASQPRCPGATSETSARAAREIDTALRDAGFCRPQVETLQLEPPVVCVIATTDGSTADEEQHTRPARGSSVGGSGEPDQQPTGRPDHGDADPSMTVSGGPTDSALAAAGIVGRQALFVSLRTVDSLLLRLSRLGSHDSGDRSASAGRC
jgi:SAM-dependent methyltransferase